MQAATDWVVLAATALLLTTILVSWLATYHARTTEPVRSGDWFFVLPVWAQILGGLGGCVFLAYVGYRLWISLPFTIPSDAQAVLRIVGLVFFLSACVLVIWARWTLGAFYGLSTSFAAPLLAKHRLISHGPYAFVRHPMYFGYWVLLVGLELIYLTWTPLFFLVMCLPAFYLRAHREEAALAERFGQEWSAYAGKTRFMIPFLY